MVSIRLLTINIESAQNIHRGYWQYLTSFWKLFLPHSTKPIDITGDLIITHHIDIAAFTEIGGPSLQSRFKNQVDELARKTGLIHTSFNRTIKIWKFLNQGNGVVSRFPITNREYYRLYSRRDPRYLEATRITAGNTRIAVLVTHLSLRKKYRAQEFQELCSIIKTIHEPLILCGDFNTGDPSELIVLDSLGLKRITYQNTYPSWNPKRSIDHIYISKEFIALHVDIVPEKISDHLGIIAELELNEKKNSVSKRKKN